MTDTLQKTIEAAFEDRANVTSATKGERREARGVRTEKRGDSLKTATKKP